MEQGGAGLLEEEHGMIEVNLGDMESNMEKQEEYWLVAIKSARVWHCWRSNVPKQCSVATDRYGHLIFSQYHKSLCMQGWMAFNSQSYQGPDPQRRVALSSGSNCGAVWRYSPHSMKTPVW
jgi:hypothetical protein